MSKQNPANLFNPCHPCACIPFLNAFALLTPAAGELNIPIFAFFLNISILAITGIILTWNKTNCLAYELQKSQ